MIVKIINIVREWWKKSLSINLRGSVTIFLNSVLFMLFIYVFSTLILAYHTVHYYNEPFIKRQPKEKGLIVQSEDT